MFASCGSTPTNQSYQACETPYPWSRSPGGLSDGRGTCENAPFSLARRQSQADCSSAAKTYATPGSLAEWATAMRPDGTAPGNVAGPPGNDTRVHAVPPSIDR